MKKSIRINKYCTDDKNNPERMGCELSKESWKTGVRKSKNTVCTGIMDFDRGIHRLSCSKKTKNLKCNFQTELDLTKSGKIKLKSSGYKKKRLPYLNCYNVDRKNKSKSKRKKTKKKKIKTKMRSRKSR